MFKILVITPYAAGSYEGGVAVFQRVVDFPTLEGAEKAVENIIKARSDVQKSSRMDLIVIRLY